LRILLTGAGGQLAEDLRSVLAADEVVAMTRAELDVRDRAAVLETLDRIRPACVLNTAAFNLVDACEERCEEAFAVNALGAGNLAQAAQRAGAVMVHFSTNYVFDGAQSTPYVETDAPRPLSAYAMSKLAGEWVTQHYCEKHFVVRTAALYGSAGNRSKGGNFIERMLKQAKEGKPVRVVNDQFVNPTSTRELAERLAPLLRSGRFGLYHMVNSGGCSWYDIAREAFRLRGVNADLAPTTTAALAAKARRPLYSVLDNRALRQLGFADFRPWQEALASYLRANAQ